MGGTWTERGIECSKGHFVADNNGTVVCHKGKTHCEQVPVGTMVQERQEEQGLNNLSVRDRMLRLYDLRTRTQEALAQTSEKFEVTLQELQKNCDHPWVVETGPQAYTGAPPMAICVRCMLEERPDRAYAVQNWENPFRILTTKPIKRVSRSEFEQYREPKAVLTCEVPGGLI